MINLHNKSFKKWIICHFKTIFCHLKDLLSCCPLNRQWSATGQHQA